MKVLTTEHQWEHSVSLPVNRQGLTFCDGIKDILPPDSVFLQTNTTKELLEAMTTSYGVKQYGFLPHFSNLTRHLGELPKDIEFLKPLELMPDEVESLLFYRLKFGQSIVCLITKVLENYPQISQEPGETIYITGLPGAGKSLAVEAISESYGERMVVMDGDTTRLNLLARSVIDIESSYGTPLAEIKGLMHTSVLWVCQIAMKFIAFEIKKRGYIILQWSAVPPSKHIDRVYYIAHRLVRIENLPLYDATSEDSITAYDAAVDTILKITDVRAEQGDTFDWEHCDTVYRFSDMKGNGFSRIPKSSIVSFLIQMKDFIEKAPDVIKIENPEEKLQVAKERILKMIKV